MAVVQTEYKNHMDPAPKEPDPFQEMFDLIEGLRVAFSCLTIASGKEALVLTIHNLEYYLKEKGETIKGTRKEEILKKLLADLQVALKNAKSPAEFFNEESEPDVQRK